MSRSPYIDEVVLTSKHSGKRTQKVQAFVIHHMAAKWTGERCARYFRDTPGRQASANYCIGYDGDVALNVEEENRAWTSSSNWADQRAITFELANSKTGHPWEVSNKTIDKAIVMLAELHERYGLKKASYTGDTKGTLWRHDWFYNTNCPGPYLAGKLSYIADEVNKILREKDRVDAPKAPEKKPANPPKKASAEQVAQDIAVGKGGWGNNPERARKLKAAGYDAKAVQARVNDILKGKTKTVPKKSSGPKIGQTVTTRTLYVNSISTKNVRSSPVKGYIHSINNSWRNPIRLTNGRNGSWLGFTRPGDIL